jgi:predicted CoA-substrate-specific enzyme activase
MGHGEALTRSGFFAGIDIGASYIKAVVIKEDKEMLGWSVERSGADLQGSIKRAYDNAVAESNVPQDSIAHITTTGFGRNKVPFSNSSITEISCHAKGVYHNFPRKITIIDIGGQDTKVIKLDEKGKMIGFKMNRKCAAGTGAFLEEIAHRLDIPMDEMNVLASKSTSERPLASYCTVFAKTEILTRIKEGEKAEDMVKSAFESVARRVLEMDSLKGTVVMTGGVVAHNSMIVKIIERYHEGEILMPPYPQLSGAFGAALFARESKKQE